jgi:hypothetical protein
MSSKQPVVKSIQDVEFEVPFKQNNHKFVRCTYCGIGILVDKGNGYVNAAKMVLEYGSSQKRNNLTHYLQGNDWKELMTVYQEEVVGKDVPLVVVYASKDGFSPITSGTYIHPKLTLHLAMWVDKRFAVKVQRIMDSVDKFVHRQVRAKGLVDNPENTGKVFDEFIQNWEHANQMMYDMCSEFQRALRPSESAVMWGQFEKMNSLFENTTGKKTGLIEDEEEEEEVEKKEEEEEK